MQKVLFVLGSAMAAVLTGTVVSSVGGRPTARGQDQFTPVTVSLVGSDTAAVRGSDGRFHVVYELLLTNAKRLPATLETIEVLKESDGSLLFRFEHDQIVQMLHNLDTTTVDDAILAPNQSRLLFVSLRFDSENEIPDSLTHRITVTAAAGPGAREPSSVAYTVGPLDLSQHRPPVFVPPLRGDGWLVVNGCCAGAGAHRGAVQSVNGKLFDSQRFAIDWMKIDGDGRLVVGDPSTARNWVDYGAEIHAAADGIVIAMRNDLEDQVPGMLPDPNSITLETVLGNFVVISHGGSVFTFYAHMQLGSVQVEAGDQVKAGDQLGLLGNSGNTSAPHLHFHVMTGPSPLGSDGIPFAFDSFVVTAQTDDDAFEKALEGAADLPRRSELEPKKHENELPLDNVIVDFRSRD